MFHLTKSVLFVLVAAAMLVIAPGSSRLAFAAEDKDTELAKHMEEIQDNLKKLRKTVKDPAQNKASLEALTKIQLATVASKALPPKKAETKPEAERPKYIADYRKDMVALLDHLGKIEVALLDNDNAKAEELFKGLKKVEDDGHEKFSDQ
jgi:soluble cytochrome b562